MPARLSVRKWGAVLFGLTLAEGALGIVSAGQVSGSPTGLLAIHIALGLGVVALSAWVLASIWLGSNRSARFAAAFTTGGLASTAATGAIFLRIDFAQSEVVDRGLALLALAGTVLMTIWGSDRGPPRAPSKSERERRDRPRPPR